MRGRINTFFKDRRYGFITAETGQDHFFTVRDVIGGTVPQGGEPVEFNPGSSPKGLRALNVQLTGAAPAPSPERWVVCGGCQRQIVPRLNNYQGEVQQLVCPFCGAVIKQFRTKSTYLRLILIVLGSLVVLGSVPSWLGMILRALMGSTAQH